MNLVWDYELRRWNAQSLEYPSAVRINSGAVIAFDSPVNLLSPLRGRVWQVSCGSEAEAEFTGRYPCSGVRRDMGVSTLRLISDEPPSRDALEAEPNMEDMYLWYFKR